MLEDKIQKPSDYLVWFSIGGYVMDQRSRDGRLIGWLKKTSGSIAGQTFPKFEMLDARIASALNKIIQNSQFKKKVSLEEQKAQKEDRFLRGRQIAFIIYDYFRVAGAHDTVFDYADLFSVTLRDDNVQDFDTDGTKFYYLCQRYHCRFRKLRHQRQRQDLATLFPYIYRLRYHTCRRFSRLWDKDVVSRGKIENLDVNAAFWEFFHVRHSSSCSSSWERLYGEFAFYQESVQEIIETVVSSQLMWRETTLLTDKAVQFATAKPTSFCDSVLCLDGISSEPVKAWGK